MDKYETVENKVRVAVDAMGGDLAPENQVLGSLSAAKENFDKLEIILVGKKSLIENVLSKKDIPDNISIVDASEVITMNDSPSEAFKTKTDSSLSVALKLQKEKKADALISAGNTGAVLTHSTLTLGRIKGITRPTIGSIFPTSKGKTMVFDVGATVDCRPNHLFEYAVMGSVYMNYMYKIKNPKVGLLSVGEEETKGNELTIEAFKLLKKSNLNFIGNLEGRDVLNGTSDVVICDGFIGNIILKFAESVLDVLKSRFGSYAEKSFFHKIWIGLFYGTLKKVIKDFDYQSHGGVPLLGVNGVSIIGHGKSSSLAIKNMILKAVETVRNNVNYHIEFEINNNKIF